MAGPRRARPRALVLAAILVLAGCGLLPIRFDPPPHPAEAPPPVGAEGYAVWRAALASKVPRIVVSLRDRRLWLLEGADTVLSAPVAIGRDEVFSYRGKTYHFRTPRGRRTVLRKETDPVWVPPEWHYLEKAARDDLELVYLERGRKYELKDGTYLEIRGDQVGRVNKFGNFWAITPGMEIVFYDTIFVPPLDTAQRRIPDALGPYKLDLGDGYMIHGTHEFNRNSIGRAASHGCIRMRNEDLERLYQRVQIGTPVYIY